MPQESLLNFIIKEFRLTYTQRYARFETQLATIMHGYRLIDPLTICTYMYATISLPPIAAL